MFSFRLSQPFVDSYREKTPPFGFRDAAGNSVGEITFLRTYSRKKEDGTKETWVDVCERVINGMYSIQKDHCKAQRLPWSDAKAAASAKEAFDRMFNLKWTPPGRGLWVMGTPLVNKLKNGAALQNCAFVSTRDMTHVEPSAPFTFMMDALMLGVGVGFDDLGGDKGFKINRPGLPGTHTIPDTREGWVESVGMLIDSYLKPNQPEWVFDYSIIRPAGAPIRTFGGTASGPGPLKELHTRIRQIMTRRLQDKDPVLTRVDVADIGNLIGVCVVAGNVRRSAELLLGRVDDENFVNLKNVNFFPERNSYDKENMGWGFMSNNSVNASVGQNLDHLVDRMAINGEPGVIWMDVTRAYGRLADAPDHRDRRAMGFNPCSEQPLESYECCTLVETYLGNHESKEDFHRTLKFAYLYAKTVTLLSTHWPRTNAVMQRNRRIGSSVSGVADFVDNSGMPALKEWLDEGFAVVRAYDTSYSEWLGIRESIKVTTVKPSGTVSLLAGSSPGVHWAPGGTTFLRAIRFANNDPSLPLFRAAGYRVEDASESPGTTSVVFFPVKSKARRSEKDVTIFEKASLAATLQRYWSDNGVSVTVSFDREKEGHLIAPVLRTFEGQLKSVSFLPMADTTYQQMPYTSMTDEEYEAYGETLFPVDLSPVYAGMSAEAIGEEYCTTSTCEIKEIALNTDAA